MIYFTLVSTISKVDSKGRISIPIGLRAKIGSIEGSRVKIILDKDRLIVTPDSEISVSKNTKSESFNKNTVGILGGMGPEATADLYLKIINICQRKYGAKFDEDYPPMLIYSIPIPDVVKKLKNEKVMISLLIKGIKTLEYAGANFIVVACNAVQSYLPYLQKFVSIPIISTIKEIGEKVKIKKYKKVGLLATSTAIKLNVFESEFNKLGIKLIKPDDNSQSEITRITLNLMSGEKLQSDKKKLKVIIEELEQNGAEAIILGCTELPLIMNKEAFNIELFDSTEILAETIVKKSFADGQRSVRVSTEVCGTSRPCSSLGSGLKGKR